MGRWNDSPVTPADAREGATPAGGGRWGGVPVNAAPEAAERVAKPAADPAPPRAERTRPSPPRPAPLDPSGNEIDTSRPKIGNDDGSFSTERTIGISADVGDGEKNYNIPTIVDGKQVTPDEAVRLFYDGKNPPVGTFETRDEADAAAPKRSEAIGEVRGEEEGPGALKRGFISGIVEQNPAMTAEALEALSYLTEDEEIRKSLLGASESARSVAAMSPEQYEMQAGSLWDSGSFDEALTWAGEALGQGLASTVPSVITGMAGGAAASRLGGRKTAVAGAITGAAVPSAALNYGEVYKALKDEGVPPELAAEYGAYAAGPMVMLDTVSVGPIVKRLGGLDEAKRQVARNFARRVAAEAGSGFKREAVTEALQETVKEATVSLAADKPFWTVETAGHIAEAGIAGGLTGGAIGGASGVRRDSVAPVPTGDEQAAGEPAADTARGEEEAGQIPPVLRTPPPAPSQPGALGAAVETGKRVAEEVARVRQATQPEPTFLDTFPEDEAPLDVPPIEQTVAAAPEGASTDLEAPSETAGTGERTDPVRLETPADVAVAAERTAEPTEAQKEAGNYQKRHVKWQGLDIAIETEEGQQRRGRDSDGEEWSVTMPAPYGYVKRTEGADGDHVDVYVGPDPQAPQVFIVDQIDAETGKFDEHKILTGFPTEAEARATYEAAFSDGRGIDRVGAITAMSVDDFKAWLKEGNTRKALGYRAAAKEATRITPDAAKDFYQTTGYAQINRFLREGEFPANLQGADRQKAEATIAALKEAAVPASEDMVVYRGMPVGKVGKDNGFVSVTTDRRLAHDHARKTRDGAVVRVSVPKGTPVIPMPGGESEYLLLPGTEMAETRRTRLEIPSSTGRREVAVVDAVLGAEAAATAARASEAELRPNETESPEPSPKSGRVRGRKANLPKGPRDIFQFLADHGGIRDEQGELRAMDLQRVFMPGRGKLVRPGGLPLDRARELAEEAGYITSRQANETASVDDLLQALSENAQGRKVFAAEDMSEVRDREARGRYEEEDARYGEYEAAVRESAESIGLTLTPAEQVEAAMMIERGADPDEAVVEVAERYAIEFEAELAEDADGRGLADEWTVPYETARETGTRAEAPQESGASAETEPAAAPRGEETREQPRRDQQPRGESTQEDVEKDGDAALRRRILLRASGSVGYPEPSTSAERRVLKKLLQEGLLVIEPPRQNSMTFRYRLAAATTERTDAGEQSVIPGAERISDKDLAERRMEGAKRSAREQKPADEGLFDTGARGQGDLVDMAKAPPPQGGEPRSAPIADFGETIAGARKEYAANYRDQLADAIKTDLLTAPLSKAWPEPDYQKLLADGADPWTVAFVRAARDEVPVKPRASWKIKGWVAQVEFLRDFSQRLLAGEIMSARVSDELSKRFELRDVQGRLDLYMEVGHDVSLKGVRIRSADYSVYGGVEYKPSRTIWTIEKPAAATAFSNWPRELAQGETRNAAIANFKSRMAAGAMKVNEAPNKQVRFDIFTYRTGEKAGKFIIGKKAGGRYIELESFPSAAEARAYRADNYDALVAKLAKAKEIPDHRKESNSPRVGFDHRAGADVTPEQFMEAFGFRGVQFGNYVEQAKRQADLNEAYDALMDLAGILNVPSRALSLNGELGLAFGARGKGKRGKMTPSAHYEPGHIVINLTKNRGAGSLAHEWWHSLDNYFSRKRGDKDSYVSEKAYDRGEGIRPEIVKAFNKVTQTINATKLRERSRILDRERSKDYWSTGREMSARSFESYVIEKLRDQGGSNDYLANVVSEDYWNAAASLGIERKGSYPYPEAAEIPAIRAAFDAFFQTVETREADGRVEMFSIPRPGSEANDNRIESADDALREALRDADTAMRTSPQARALDEELVMVAADNAVWARGWRAYHDENSGEIQNEEGASVAEIKRLGSGKWGLSVLGTAVAERFDTYPEAVAWVLGEDSGAIGDIPRFSRSGGTPRAPVATLTGNEAGFTYAGPESMPALRRAAKRWFDENLRGQTATTKDGLTVSFSRKGRAKSTSKKGHLLLQAVPAIRDIIEKGDVVYQAQGNRTEQLERLVIAAPVDVAGETATLAVSIHRYPGGAWQYDFSTWEGAESPGVGVPGGSAKLSASPRPAAKSASGALNLVFFDEAIKAGVLLETLEAKIRTVGLSDKVETRLVAAIRDAAGNPVPGARGRHIRGLIEVAMSAPDRGYVLDHEIVHALRDLGLFKRSEWETLSRAAKADRARMQEIAKRYDKFGLTEEQLVEEAVADMFADWNRAGQPAGTRGASLLQRIADFFRALGRALSGASIQSADEIFAAVQRGEVGGRGRQGSSFRSSEAAAPKRQGRLTALPKERLSRSPDEVRPVSVVSLRDRLVKDGWRVRHTSKKQGKITSVYLNPPGAPSGNNEIRISDHELGRTIYGEEQGGRWSVNIVVDPSLSIEDHLRAIADEDYRDSFSGFATGYSAAEFDQSDAGRFSVAHNATQETPELDAFVEQVLPEVDSWARPIISDFVRYMPADTRAALNEQIAEAEDDAARVTALADALEVTMRGSATGANLSKAIKDSTYRLRRTIAKMAEERQAEDEADFLANMVQEPREPGRKRKERNGSSPKEARGALRALRRAPPLPDPGDYRWLSRFLLHPYQIATKDAQFADVFHWGAEFNRLRNESQVLLGQVVEPYMALDEAQRSNVNKVLEVGRLDGRDFSADETITVTNEGHRNAMLPVGETVTLTEAERQGYLAVRAMFDRALLMFKQQVLKEANLGAPGDPRTAEGIRQFAQDQNEDLTNREREELERAAGMVEEIEKARRAGYVPFSRYGDYSVTVTDSFGQTAYFAKVEKGPGDRERVAKLRKELEERFPRSEGFIVQKTQFRPKADISGIQDIDFAVLDDMAKRGGADAETVDAYHKAVQASWSKEGFRSHFVESRNVPGYEQDFTRSISDYIVGITGYLARRNAMDPMEQAVQRIAPAKQELRRYAKAYKNYIFNPVEEFGQWRQLMFYAYLAGNPSSAALNLTQLPIFTYPFLTMVTNPVKAAAALADASRITMQMFRPGLKSEFLNFNIDAAPADIREDLKTLLRDGTLVPMVTLENMGVAQGRKKFLRGAGKRGRQVLEIAGTLFTSAERFNRIATAVAALRLARDAKVMKRAEKAFAASNIWQDLAPAAMPGTGAKGASHTPIDLARFVIWETHFLQGKMNRPTALRGIGAPIAQFKSFTMNALQVQWRMASIYGAEGKRAFALNMLGLFLASGLFGLPFADDGRDWFEFFYRFLNNVDIDLEKELQAAAVDILGEEKGPAIGEAIRRGVLRQSGVDMSQRIGMGRILPFSPPSPSYTNINQLEQMLEPLGIPASVLVTGLRAGDHMVNGDWATGFAELSRYVASAGGANIFKAGAMIQEGLRTRNRALLIHPDDLQKSDIWLRAAGFQSTRLAREYEKNWMQTRADRAVSELQSNFYKRLAVADAAGDIAEYDRIWDEIFDWNEDQPEYMQITINDAYLRRKVDEEFSGRLKDRENTGPRKAGGERSRIDEVMP